MKHWKTLNWRWVNVSWTFADQCVVSGTNFILGVTLARLLGVKEFGIYTLCVMGVWFIQAFNNALVYAPMLSIAPKLSPDERAGHFGVTFLHQGILIVLILGAGCIITFLKSMQLLLGVNGLPIGALTVAAAALVSQEFLRRYFYARGRPHLAFVNSIISSIMQGICLAVLYAYSTISLNAIFFAIASASIIALAVNSRSIDHMEFRTDIFGAITRRHWAMSKWMLTTVIASWFTGNFFYITGGIILGPTAVGAMRAASLTLAAGNIIMQGIDNYLPPSLGQTLRTLGIPAAWTHAARTAIASVAFVTVISLVICAAPEFWFTLIFGHRYSGYEWLLYSYGVLNPLNTLFIVGAGTLRVMERPSITFAGWMGMTIFSVMTAGPIIHYWGLAGAAWGLVVAQLIGLLILGLGLMNFRRKESI